jgi:hypothetical protein
MRAPKVMVQRDVAMNRIARVHAADRWTDAQEPRTYAAPSPSHS